MLTTGRIITTDDSYCGTLTQDNIVRHLLTAGKTWKVYAESLPYADTQAAVCTRMRSDNPLAEFSDVANSIEKHNLVPFNAFPTDLAYHNLPQFSFIVPNLLNNTHEGSLSAADWWLKTNIASLLAGTKFQSDGLLIIVFDEGVDSDTQHGGGHVACVVIGPKVKYGVKSTTLYPHQNTLRTLMQALGLASFPGATAGAYAMTSMF